MIKSKDETWGAFLLELLVLVLIVLFIRFYIFQFFRVFGESMCPTLNQIEDQCISQDKGEFIFVNEILYQIRPPKRGEIVVFRPTNKRTYYVKRVIGVPGDRVEIRDGEVFIANEAEGIDYQKLQEDYLSDLNQGRTETSQDIFEVPEGEFLLFGDNRRNSSDSRRCFSGGCESGKVSAYIPQKNIVGRAEFVVWPFWTMRDLENDPWGWYKDTTENEL